MSVRQLRGFPHVTILLLCCLLTALAVAWPHPALAQDATTEILAAINQARADAGLGALQLNPLLTQAAQGHVDDMNVNYVYGHYGSDGSTVQVRVARTGYSARPWVSENWVSAGSPAGAMRWWMNDYVHRANILTPRWQEIGIGVASRGSEMIFVAVFSAGTGSASVASVEEIPADEPPSMRIQQEAVPPGGLDYTIQGGDTLLAIGLRYGLPWERLADANALTERSLLQIGQVIHVPGEGSASAVAPDVKDVETELYQVQPGDTLFGIAAQRGLSWQEVAAVNGFGEQTVLQIAQVIFVPKVTVPEDLPADVAVSTGTTVPMDMGASASIAAIDTRMVMAVEGQPVATMASVSAADKATEIVGTGGAVADTNWYAVAPGDTVISIALRYQLEWQALLALNGLADDTLLQVGQRLRLH